MPTAQGAVVKVKVVGHNCIRVISVPEWDVDAGEVERVLWSPYASNTLQYCLQDSRLWRSITKHCEDISN